MSPTIIVRTTVETTGKCGIVDSNYIAARHRIKARVGGTLTGASTILWYSHIGGNAPFPLLLYNFP
jgi:hypothetical protein